MYVAVPLYATIEVADLNEAQRAKAAIEQLLKNDMLRMLLASSNVRLSATSVGDPYECAPPGAAQPQQQQYYNGRR